LSRRGDSIIVGPAAGECGILWAFETLVGHGGRFMTGRRFWIGALGAAGLVLTAAGCTGTDFLNTGNANVRLEVAAVGTPSEEIDCLIFELEEVRVRPLDGLCGTDSSQPDKPCLKDSDCPAGTGPGTCVGSNATEVVPNSGIVVALASNTEQGDLWNGPCESTNPLIEQFFQPSLNRGVWKSPPSFVLSDGLYAISSSRINNIRLYRDDPSPTFEDGLLKQCVSSSTISMVQGLGAEALRFTMNGEDKVIRYEVNIGALLDLWGDFDSNNCTLLRQNMPSIIECVGCDAGVAP